MIPLWGGYILDLLFGDPLWFPHPVKGFGKIIHIGDAILNKGKYRLLKGAILSLILILFTWILVYTINLQLSHFMVYIRWFLQSIMVYFCVANRNLIDEGKAVFKALENSITEGRKRLSWIVGRDTQNLNENQIRIAVFETMSENLSDGVIAPLTFYALGGVPAMFAYKMINTLDSMIGYKNEQYEQFGKIAARTDDIANFIPARITALLIALVSFKKLSLTYILKYGNKHSSPNSGYPEAAMAGATDCRFGGPNYYKGKLVNKPYIGENDREIKHCEISDIVCINHKVTLLGIVIITTLYYVYLNII